MGELNQLNKLIEKAKGPSILGVLEQSKVTQAVAQYVETSERDDQNCKNCFNFISEDKTCQVVEGQVSPTAWCRFWKTDFDMR